MSESLELIHERGVPCRSLRQQDLESAAREQVRQRVIKLLDQIEEAAKEYGRADECWERREPVRPTFMRLDAASGLLRMARIELEGLVWDALQRGRWSW